MNETNPKQKNLVIGVAANYNFEQLKPFIYSLKQTGYEGEVCLLVADLDVSTLRQLQQLGVQTVPMVRPWLRKSLSNLVDLAAIFSPKEKRQQIKFFCAASSLPMHDSRFLYSYLYLAECGKSYSNIMLTDVRDVVFQRDPFDFSIPEQVCFFLEDIKIKDCFYNSEWILTTFGKNALRELKDKTVSCAGVTIGSYSAIMSYLEMMADYMIRLRGRIAHLPGSDQAIHNVILYRERIKNIKVFENGHAPVLTMGTMDKAKIQLNHEGFLLNENGSVANIIHQYDRHSEIQAKLMAKYTSDNTKETISQDLRTQPVL
jgi:hypothetical protein